MKTISRLIMFVLYFLPYVSFTQGLNLQLNSIMIYGGKSPLSSGFGAICIFENENKSKNLMLEFNNTFQQAVYTKTISKSLSLGPTGGLLNNAVWLAPIVIFCPTKKIFFTSWNGVFFGEPNKPLLQANFAFAYHAINITLGNFHISYSILHFMMEVPMNLPSIKYSLSLNKTDYLVSSMSYHIRDDKPMFFMAWSHKF